MSYSSKAQVSIEYILVVGFAFLMLTPLIVIFYTSSNDMNDQVTMSQADKIANEIVAAADQVYYQGPPTKKTLKVYMPENVESIIIQNNWIKINTKQTDGAPRASVANLTGNIDAFGGIHNIEVIAISGGVMIADG